MRKEGTFKFWELISKVKVENMDKTTKVFFDSLNRYMK
jgi:hypothetical protein